MAKSTFVYVTYIRTTPEKLWSALTDLVFMMQYWFGLHCESQWIAGSSWKLVYRDGRIAEAEPPRRLVIRWQDQIRGELKAEGESHCTMETGIQWCGAQALHHPHHRGRTLESDCLGVQLLAEDHLQPEVPAGDRFHRSAGYSALSPLTPFENGRSQWGRVVVGGRASNTIRGAVVDSDTTTSLQSPDRRFIVNCLRVVLGMLLVTNGLIANWREYEVESPPPWDSFVGENRF